MPSEPISAKALAEDLSADEIAELTASFVEGTLSPDVLFSSLGDDTSRTYELAISHLASRSTDRKALVNKLREVLADTQIPADTRYAVFYLLVECLRYDKNISEMNKAIKEYESEFGTYPSYTHLRLLGEMQGDIGTMPDAELDQLIEDAFLDAQKINTNEGYPHLFADLVATACEKKRGDRLEELKHKWLQRAEDMANAAIKREPNYAKFYSTLGRLKALEGEYDEAHANIALAIDKESSDRTDYAIRIGGYQAALINTRAIEVEANTEQSRLEMLENMEAFSKELAAAKEEIEDSKTSNLEFLGFFTALISFTIGSLGLVQDATPLDAAGIIVVLAGALLLVFAGFTFIILRDPQAIKRKSLPMAVMGLIVLIAGFVWLSVVH